MAGTVALKTQQKLFEGLIEIIEFHPSPQARSGYLTHGRTGISHFLMGRWLSVWSASHIVPSSWLKRITIPSHGLPFSGVGAPLPPLSLVAMEQGVFVQRYVEWVSCTPMGSGRLP